MRATSIALASCSVIIGLTLAGAAHAEAVKVTPELTVFSAETTKTDDGRPTVLRGSATRRGTVSGRADEESNLSRFALGAGDKLWLTDPVSGEVVVCDERRSSRVGSRFVGCVRDQLPEELYD
jgi:hypothetical protein